MKKSDCIGIAFFVLFALLVVFFPFRIAAVTTLEGGGIATKWTGFTLNGLQQFGNFTEKFPYWMGFFKFACLATFGEMLKNRMKAGSWRVDLFPLRAITWGVFGMIMTFAFALFATGLKYLMKSPIWFDGNVFVFAISTSVWMNLIFAYPMMLSHEWCNDCLTKRRFVGGEEFFRNLNAHVWGSFIPKTILYFWIPAHTVTFLIPAQYRVLMGAHQSVALGYILTFRADHRK